MPKISLYKHLNIGLATAIALFLLYSCSINQNTNIFKRGYENLTTHYNIYWNGKESLNEAESFLKKNAYDNYGFILPIYNYGTADNVAQVQSQLNRAIEKATLAIPRHTLYFDGREYNRWIDDCYLVLGKAYFFKQDYSNAQLTMRDIINEFSGTASAEEAYVWLIRSLIQQKKFKDALSEINNFEKRIAIKKPAKQIQAQLPLFYADYFLAQKEYAKASKYLQDALPLSISNNTRHRIIYILGQLAYNENRYADAASHFRKVAHSNVSFEMEFNAHLNMIISNGLAEKNIPQAKRNILQMLEDKKYAEYKDRIYYGLYALASAENKTEEANRYLLYSAIYATGNASQKVTAFRKLSDWYFEKQQYDLSYAYADSVLQILPESYPEYDMVKNMLQVKKELAQNHNTIKVEDSLQYMAKLTDAEVNQKIKIHIEQIKANEQEIATALKKPATSDTHRTNRPYIMTPQQMGMQNTDWYFDNPYIITIGAEEFARRWGKRELQDNWRLSSKLKSSLAVIKPVNKPETDSLNMEENDLALAMKNFDRKNPESYLKAIPRTQQEIAASNHKIAKALINLGYIYKDDVNDNDNAIIYFEEYIKRFSTTEEDYLPVYFQLYVLGLQTQNTPLAEKYKQIILNDYPASDFAQVVLDPSYMKVLYDKKFRASSLYEETYMAYTRGQYRLVLLYAESALSEYKQDKELTPRFEYLKAIALGKSQGTEVMVTNLINFIKKYPNHLLAPLAQEVLGQYNKKEAFDFKGLDKKEDMNNPLNNTVLTNQQENTDTAKHTKEIETQAKESYTYAPSKTYYYLFVYDMTAVNPQEIRKVIAEKVDESFQDLGLTINIIQWSEKLQILAISKFTDEKAGMDFYRKIHAEISTAEQLKNLDYKHFIISSENYPIFFRDKNTGLYQEFFEKNYNK